MGVRNGVEYQRPPGFGVRHIQTFFLFLGMLLAYCMRVNMSIAIVDMTNSDNDLYFDWTYGTQSIILSSFYWGYVVFQIPSGVLAGKIGGKILIIVVVSTNAILSLMLPIAGKLGDWKLVCLCRVLQGLFQAPLFPSMHQLLSQWVPLEEKGTLCTLVYAGSTLGIFTQNIVSGLLATAFGWQSIFYVNGALGIIWTIGYVILGAATPEQSGFIKQDELKYIQASLGRTEKQKSHPTPFKKIIKCLPFWAAVAAHCGQNWGFIALMTEMPTYMAKVLDVKLSKNGMLSALPYLSMYVLSFPMGMMTDVIIRRGWLNVTNTRKLFNSIGLWGPAIALIGLSYMPEGNMLVAVIMLTITVGVNAGHYTGYTLVLIDMAPNFSASLMGISNCFANIVSLISPLIWGVIIEDETDPAEWRKCFFLSSGIYFLTNLCFVLFATSVTQSWNEPENNEKSDNKTARND
ncbi:putative inorganic phosphate cotransporter [Colias croceus]|uniref:putative inorganic phosphate cotransporter n=1 Tax=Colias crocea TaxID=72248 RepID=UPI001E280655|nr:putative inorganic phosphate cotransporter [Colias croceus]